MRWILLPYFVGKETQPEKLEDMTKNSHQEKIEAAIDPA